MKNKQAQQMANPNKETSVKGNPMKEILFDKVTLNMCVGNDEAGLTKALKLLELISGAKPIKTLAKKRIPTWQVRPGLAIGCKVTLQKSKAVKVLKQVLGAKDNRLEKKQFGGGIVSFGVKEYIQIPGAEYQREIGIMGFDVAVTLKRRGFRVAKRKIKSGRIPLRHKINKDETIEFMKKHFNVEVEKKIEEY